MRSETDAPKAVVIIPYFGKFGSWFPLFLDSLSRQSTLDLLLLTDAETPPLPANARCVTSTLAAVAERAQAALGMPVNLPGGYKLCDLRPAYGLVFEEYLHGYDYWAFGDEDVVYGDLDRLLAPRLADRPDMVVPQNDTLIGHLTILRNSAHLNRLVLEEPGYADVLADGNHWGFDETSWARDFSRPSFTRTVKRAEARGEIKVNWGLPLAGNVPGPSEKVAYDGKRWLHSNKGELAYYHWGRLRDRGWRIPDPQTASSGFEIDRFGIYEATLSSPGKALRRAKGYGHAIARGLGKRLGRAATQRKVEE